jgi:hypothetical protein
MMDFDVRSSFQGLKSPFHYQVNSREEDVNPLEHKDIHDMTSTKLTIDSRGDVDDVNLTDQSTIDKSFVLEIRFTGESKRKIKEQA